MICTAIAAEDSSVEQDPDTGLVIADGWEMVKGQCTICHSARLITQSQMSRQSWIDSIRWMQAGQGLWDLGETEPVILDYLATNYSVRPGNLRRMPLIPVQPD